MGERPILPRLVVRADTGLSREGPVPPSATVDAVDRALGEFGRVLVWDLDGIQRNRPNLAFTRRFEGEGLWVDAGVRTPEAVIDVLVAGADRAVVGTKTLMDLETLEESRDLTENLALLLDFAEGELWAPGDLRGAGARELLRIGRDLGIDSALLVDEDFAIPGDVLLAVPEGVRAFAGVGTRNRTDHLPDGVGLVVDLWEVVPRTT